MDFSPSRFTFTRTVRSRCARLIFVIGATCAVSSSAQDSQVEPALTSNVAATVNGDVIAIGQVERDLSKSLGKILLNPKQKLIARSATLEKQINQKVAFDFLKANQADFSDDEVRLQLEDLKSQLATVEKTIDDYLKETDQTLAELKFQIAWRSSWPTYLKQKLTDEVLEAHFDQHRRRFDGTQLRVAHLLLKPDDSESALSNENEARRQNATAIRDDVLSNVHSWGAAVEAHSNAPTRQTGGEIGWIKIDGPMPKSFTEAAFSLSPGEISQPVETRFGIHLIKCLEVKQGTLGWRDTIDSVKKSASRTYFDTIVENHRPKLKIEYGSGFGPKN